MKLRSSDLLSITVGAVVIDVIFLIFNFNGIIFVSDQLTRWYTSLGTSAVAMDVIVIVLAVTVGVAISVKRSNGNPTLMKTVGWVVLVQVVHDMLFAFTFQSVERGKNYIFDFFKDYADEIGGHAVWSDSLMVMGTLVVAELCCDVSTETQRILLLASIYVGLFSLYSKKPT